MRPQLMALALAALAASAANAQVTVSVDVAANRHPISPLIYGVHFAGATTLLDLNATVNRYGGNSAGRYNWQQNVDNRGSDYFFESIPYASATPGGLGDSFIGQSQAGGAQPFLTIPMVDWIAKAGPLRSTLWSFSVNTYGAQCAADGDAGNGLLPNCLTHVGGNNKNDASIPNTSLIQQGWFQHVKDTFGSASTTGLKYWGYDNEPSIWFNAYWDVVPTGKHDTEMVATMIDYGSALRALDQGVTILGPEEWGWDALFYSGFDQQSNAACGYCGNTPDNTARGPYVAYLLDQLHQYEIDNPGKRLLDVATLHFYPQGTEYYPDSNASDPATQLLRNRSTRGLWDPGYLNESYINDFVRLIPRMKTLVSTHYPGLKVGLTEYNWGGDFIMSGATVQADILGILGREGADMAIRWDTNGFTPAMPPYKAFKMYRNYDGAKSTFGDTSVSASVPDPDTLAAFAAQRTSSGALTIMVVSKVLSGNTATTINLANFTASSPAQVWQLTANTIAQLADVAVAGNSLSATLPAQSVTLFVVPASGGAPVADLAITKTDGQTTAVPGTPVTYTIVASNAGPNAATGATVVDAVPAEITGATWTCVGAGGGACTAAGNGSINDTVNLPAGGTVTYTLTGTISASAREGLGNTATVSTPGGTTDPNLANNSATDTDILPGVDYFTLAPCRVVDTRGGAPIGGPVLQGEETRAFAMAGQCGIPVTARAISINLAVTGPTAPGNVRLFPAGQPVPLVSSINYVAGQTRSNNAVIKLNPSGAMATFIGQALGTTVHLIIDVNGYFQ